MTLSSDEPLVDRLEKRPRKRRPIKGRTKDNERLNRRGKRPLGVPRSKEPEGEDVGRCQSGAFSFRWCTKKALPGKRMCARHGGRVSDVNLRRKKDPLVGLYGRYLGPTLQEKIESLVADPKLLQLDEEVALARLAAMQAIKMAQPVLNGEVDPDKHPKLISVSIAAVREALNHVSEMIERSIRVDKMREDKISVNTLQIFVAQLTKIIWNVLGPENEDLAAKIDEQIKNTLRVPTSDVQQDTNSLWRRSLLEQHAEMASTEMDAFTAPSETDGSLELPEEIRGSSGWETFGKNGDSET